VGVCSWVFGGFWVRCGGGGGGGGAQPTTTYQCFFQQGGGGGKRESGGVVWAGCVGVWGGVVGGGVGLFVGGVCCPPSSSSEKNPHVRLFAIWRRHVTLIVSDHAVRMIPLPNNKCDEVGV